MAPIPTKVVCLKHVISEDELKNDEEFEDIVEDMRCEGEKYGKQLLWGLNYLVSHYAFIRFLISYLSFLVFFTAFCPTLCY